jgi:hypothetical protein
VVFPAPGGPAKASTNGLYSSGRTLAISRGFRLSCLSAPSTKAFEASDRRSPEPRNGSTPRNNYLGKTFNIGASSGECGLKGVYGGASATQASAS